MYQCKCHTCEEDHLLEDLESAQTVFNEHADTQHEVVLQRIDLPLDETSSAEGEAITPGMGDSDDGRTESTPRKD